VGRRRLQQGLWFRPAAGGEVVVVDPAVFNALGAYVQCEPTEVQKSVVGGYPKNHL